MVLKKLSPSKMREIAYRDDYDYFLSSVFLIVRFGGVLRTGFVVVVVVVFSAPSSSLSVLILAA